MLWISLIFALVATFLVYWYVLNPIEDFLNQGFSETAGCSKLVLSVFVFVAMGIFGNIVQDGIVSVTLGSPSPQSTQLPKATQSKPIITLIDGEINWCLGTIHHSTCWPKSAEWLLNEYAPVIDHFEVRHVVEIDDFRFCFELASLSEPTSDYIYILVEFQEFIRRYNADPVTVIATRSAIEDVDVYEDSTDSLGIQLISNHVISASEADELECD